MVYRRSTLMGFAALNPSCGLTVVGWVERSETHRAFT
jgi:hypothetical protein